MRRILFPTLALFFHLCIYAQQTSLTIDNQNPGWLSSKINYGDQLTVRNLTVTGYLNSTDLEFIGLLMGKSLNGHINLENTYIVKDSKNEENIFPTCAFKLSEGYNVRRLSLPSTLTGMGDWINKLNVYNELSLTLDTLIIGGKEQKRLEPNDVRGCTTLIVREGVDSLGAFTEDVENLKNLTSTILPTLKTVILNEKLRVIGNGFFRNCKALTSINLPDSLVEMHSGAFQGTNCFSETLYLPSNLKVLHLGAFYDTNITEIFISDKLEKLGGRFTNISDSNPLFKEISIHLKGTLPSFLKKPSTGISISRPFVAKNWVIYVSPEFVTDYSKSAMFSNGTVLSEVEIGNINFEIPNKIYVGDDVYLTAQYSPIDATDKIITWKTDSNTIRIEKDKIIASHFGQANIIAQSSFGRIKNEKFINVYEHVSGVNINEQEIKLSIGQCQKPTIDIYPIGKNDGEVLWTSDNPQVAEVTTSGTIIAKGIGRCNVICSSIDGGFKDFCNVSVTQPVTGVTIDKQIIELTSIGETIQLQATVLPEDAENKKVKWSSSNETVCKVSEDGIVTAIEAGNATITASTEDGNFVAHCSVTIALKIKGVTLEKHELTLKVGESENLRVQITPNNANNKNIKWVSEDESIATVNNEGVVVGVKSGKVRIYATSEENSEIYDYCTVTVTQPVVGITLDKQTVELTSIGESVQLQATVLPEDAENQNVRWSSSNEKVCIVSSNGTVVGLNDGLAIIIATTEDGGFLATCQVTVNTSSHIDGVIDDPNMLIVEGNTIFIKNKSANDMVSIYSSVGKVIYEGYDDVIKLASGIYIVKIGNNYKKIAL